MTTPELIPCPICTDSLTITVDTCGACDHTGLVTPAEAEEIDTQLSKLHTISGLAELVKQYS